jgi:iron complex transport system ATP-binding protein
MGNYTKQEIFRIILMKAGSEILSIGSLLIGYHKGKSSKILLPSIDARAFKGELIAVIGQNGIGKSTLLRTLTGLQESLGGSVKINGQAVSSYSRIDLALNVGYISTETVRVSNMKVYDLVALGRFPHTDWLGKLTKKDHEITMDSIGKVGMQSFVERYVTELSDGERQRVMIARVLAQDTELLVMDEPTAFLDIRSKYEIVHLLHDLSKRRGKTIIFSTHDLNIAISEADKVWLLLQESFMEGAPEDLILNGSFNDLFRNSPVRFNQGDGTFAFRNEYRGRVKLSGEGITRKWTEKALNRAGYSVSEKNAQMHISANSTDAKNIWTIEDGDTRREFASVYDLVNWLSESAG